MTNSDHYFPLDATIISTYLKNLTISQIKVHLVKKYYLPLSLPTIFAFFLQCETMADW